jgi:hypothetical protein
MIKIEEKQNGKYLQLTGDSAEVTMFYCFWQSKLWPDWMNHKNLGESNDLATRQHSGVLKALVNGDPILLANDSGIFKEAYKYARHQVEKFGVKYQIYEMQLRMVFEN